LGRNSISLQEAVLQHLRDSGFPADGGINEKWVVVGAGPIPLCFPNTRARRKATPIHDFNHLISGYGHDAVGEAEIGAWELGGGCKKYWAAWVLNWAALLPGVLRAPGRLLRAFARGRRTGNLYGADLDAVGRQPVEEVRTRLGLDKEYPVRPGDVVLFVGVVCLAPFVGAIPALTVLLTSPWWLASGAYRQRRVMASE
jgi:hypothetical protein